MLCITKPRVWSTGEKGENGHRLPSRTPRSWQYGRSGTEWRHLSATTVPIEKLSVRVVLL